MKAFFIVTGTNEVHKHSESFACLPGNEVQLYRYNHSRNYGAWARGTGLDNEIYDSAKAYQPDLIVYVGACAGNMPSMEAFVKLKREIAPTVHFCSDAADDPWWPLLNQYYYKKCFSVQVALDGSQEWPLARTDITALTVIDPKRYPAVPLPHAERPIKFGFAGNFGRRKKFQRPVAPRTEMLEEMEDCGLQCRPRDASADSYGEYAAFLSQCRIVVNFAHTGSMRHMHVKGRVVETGLAGALLLEQKGSPTKNWFVPGVDYLEYETAEDAIGIVSRMKHQPEESQAFGARLRAKVLAEHRPEKFWGRIFDRIELRMAA